ncbi:ATP-dependent sacrificial sulfur transferase LarE [Clostridium felsineum]|uniref:Pyridinium-3,5-bisthiocarboxylic acid mononucleotide synthase n=1 Tax=Clostridium felsineum TaxID=36839 RepID=A0A1S8LQQ6_9CLOT|nr:ATP-dependent sacrificial sulfur transferase LarE [Clostridium felsineum]MCR3761524.1 ATP-dependent sacrificial sulfur transferase LarE [Clostridium felsineum]URZ01593.1 Pyridinium-3,5-bisthiocarboxylic acid mononucleotide synthase [Clostridium felsineum]URZ05569.1 Pyridinium-3,5-bisthiocarboxylic acid mononucleotide synthase [Clostridium felsineum]URZ10608.1 Pyridinium-3,5-bisthiocarboxylic acid mononucleotide synthase [Clostridium felsineum]
MINNDKYKDLIKYLKSLEKVVLAFSGGVDSTFLLRAAKEALDENVKAVTILSPYIPKWEIKEAKQLAEELGIEHEIIEAPIIDSIKFNPENRCYLCKTAVFSMILKVAKEEGYSCVIDGTNFDDIKDYRPGLKALKELEVKSPLLECKLTKQEIRTFSKELGLKTWDKPSYACLLTRIPYGNELKVEDFEKIENAEKYMMSIGFRAMRVRCHGDLARIEVNRADRSKLFDEKLLDTISENIKKCGFKYVALDLQGYRVGSFNENINK